jgi:RNA recognition motif-containing protein
MSVRLYIGNLPKSEVAREELQAVFAEAGDLVSTKVIKDRKTGKCRGFGFVTVNTDEQADEIIAKYNGVIFQDLEIKIEKALPKAKTKGSDEEGGETTGEETRANPIRNTELPKISTGNKNKKKSRRNNQKNSGPMTYTSGSDEFQPDPRWAGQLAQLKELLAEAGNP